MNRLPLPLVLIWALLAPAGVALPASEEERSARTIPIHYKQRAIGSLVESIARATGRRYVFPDTLQGRVTITVPGRVDADEAIALLNAALHILGFAALPIGDDTTKIVPVSETQSSAPRVDEPLDPERERPITTMIRLRNASAANVVATLRPYVSPWGVALPYPPTNAVILAGTEARVSRLITIIRVLDEAEDESVMARSLRYRSASVVAEMLRMQFNQGPPVSNHAEIWTDERTNKIVVRAPPDLLERVREAVKKIDQPVEGEGLLRVIPIVNRDADDVAQILTAMQKGSKPRATSVVASNEVAVQAGKSLAGRFYSVTVDPATRSLLLASDSETLGLLTEVVALLDVMPPRIEVDVLIFEVVRPASFELGIDYFLPLLEPSSPTSPAVFLSSGGSSILNSAGLPSTGVPSGPSGGNFLFGRYTRAPLQLSFDPGGGADPITILIPREEVAFQAGQFTAYTSILMRPHILALSGEEHEVFVGNEIPVPMGSASSLAGSGSGAEGNPLTTKQVIERRDVGLELRVTPTIGREGVVILDLELEISEIQSSLAGSVEQVGPTFSQRSIESTLRLSEGQFAVLGTSNGGGEAETRTGVPFLRDIPFFGSLFGSVSRTQTESDLLIVVGVQILNDPSEDMAATIRRRIAMERAIARVADLGEVGEKPFAVLLETVNEASLAEEIAEAFGEDGFQIRVTDWESTGGRLWDIYLTDFESFEDAGGIARQLSDAGWSPEITVLSPENAFAGD